MITVLKNMFRRKGRTILTIFGITIGIFAFTVMGSMAEKIGQLVNGGVEYYADKVTVRQGASFFLSGPLSVDKAREIEQVDGVAAVAGSVYTMLDGQMDAVNFGPPASIIGEDLLARKYESFVINYQSGRDLREGDSKKVVVGSDLVKKLNATIGGEIELRGKTFEVIGILEKTLTAPDNAVVVPLADAQEIYFEELPEVFKSQVSPESIVNGFTVYVDPGVDPNALAEKINNEVPDIYADGPQAFQDQVASATEVFNAILFGIAFISLLVGGLSIINTMTMAVSERTREIGIKKAVGARTRDIMGEYLTEAGFIGLFGGLLGWGLGALTVVSLNALMEGDGNIIFLLTPRVSIFAIAFATVLGVVAGFYPAWHAIKINVVKALREE